MRHNIRTLSDSTSRVHKVGVFPFFFPSLSLTATETINRTTTTSRVLCMHIVLQFNMRNLYTFKTVNMEFFRPSFFVYVVHPRDLRPRLYLRPLVPWVILRCRHFSSSSFVPTRLPFLLDIGVRVVSKPTGPPWDLSPTGQSHVVSVWRDRTKLVVYVLQTSHTGTLPYPEMGPNSCRPVLVGTSRVSHTPLFLVEWGEDLKHPWPHPGPRRRRYAPLV